MYFISSSISKRIPSSGQTNRAFLRIRSPKKRPFSHIAVRSATTDLPVAKDAPINDTYLPSAVKKYLHSIGWSDAWVDGVITEIKKKNVTTTVANVEAVITYLSNDVGLPLHDTENIISMSKSILAREKSQIAAVIDWLQTVKGISGSVLKEFLVANPTILNFEPDGDVLKKGAARASIVVQETNGKKKVGVTLWREGASFGMSPVSPAKPN